eukprot:5117688-Amphidinium_carterae.1
MSRAFSDSKPLGGKLGHYRRIMHTCMDLDTYICGFQSYSNESRVQCRELLFDIHQEFGATESAGFHSPPINKDTEGEWFRQVVTQDNISLTFAPQPVHEDPCA